MKNKVISLYTGAGGLDLGLEKAGFELALVIENDSDCINTLKQNRPNWKISEPPDITLLTSASLMKQADIKIKEASLVAGGAPCQPFSKSGWWATGDSLRLLDDRAVTIEHFMRVVNIVLPEVILFENVKGIGFKGKDEGLKYIRQQLEKINDFNHTNYKPIFFEINAADYGVPQNRERMFMIAHRDGLLFDVPKPTHIKEPNENDLTLGILPYRTTWDSIGDLDIPYIKKSLKPTGKWANLLSSIPEGSNYLWHTPRGGGMPLFGWRTRYWSFLLKLDKNRPSWTLQATPGPATGPFHWRNRKLSVREMMRIQTFPDDYEIYGTYRSATKQIGNAIPSAIGELLGAEIQQQFFNKKIKTKSSLIPCLRKAKPRKSLVRNVPEKYLELVAEHKEHPGSGKGPRAILM